MTKVPMIAKREFPRQFGDGVRRVQEGEGFEANSSEVEHLKAAGKAREKSPPKADAKSKGD